MLFFSAEAPRTKTAQHSAVHKQDPDWRVDIRIVSDGVPLGKGELFISPAGSLSFVHAARVAVQGDFSIDDNRQVAVLAQELHNLFP